MLFLTNVNCVLQQNARRGSEWYSTMCGRFTQQMTWPQIHDLYSLTGSALALNLRLRYNGAPLQDFAACRLDKDGSRAIVSLRWGLAPSWAKDSKIGVRLINARAETVHTKPSYRAAFRSRRCLVPANGWFEWQRTGYGKQPYFLAFADGSPLSWAALWEQRDKGGESLETFTIITTKASPGLADIHHRQPAIIDPAWFDEWLDPTSPPTRLLELVREPRVGSYERRAVSTRVNSVRNDDPDILV